MLPLGTYTPGTALCARHDLGQPEPSCLHPCATIKCFTGLIQVIESSYRAARGRRFTGHYTIMFDSLFFLKVIVKDSNIVVRDSLEYGSRTVKYSTAPAVRAYKRILTITLRSAETVSSYFN